MDDKLKYKVISLLQQEQQPKDIAADLDVSYGTVLKLRRQYEEAKLTNSMDKLLNVDRLVFDEIVDKLDDLPIIEEAAGELVEGLKGIEQLSVKFQQTADTINTRVRSLIMSVDHISELEIATDILCKLQTSFINKNATQVNVQNNFGDSSIPKYTQFLGDKPSD